MEVGLDLKLLAGWRGRGRVSGIPQCNQGGWVMGRMSCAPAFLGKFLALQQLSPNECAEINSLFLFGNTASLFGRF